ncbi:MAG: IMP dehydrogenase, partial [Proteobacteria bacterium]|nr:IMP dehydrogenase [Pseudomonadota bacterium]
MQLIGEALTFDDVSLQPAYSEILPADVEIQSRLTRDISINAPLASSAMDTVTEARLAIAMAQEGGIGVIHKNMTLQQQAEQVLSVKKYEAGVIKDPITVAPDTTIREVLNLTHRHNISGVPVVDGNELVGIVTSRDMRFEKRLDDPVRNIMTRKDKLITVNENAGQDEVLGLLHKYRIEKVLVVNSKFELRGLITVKDIQKSTDFPNAAKDSRERLIVAAAVGVGGDTMERVTALVDANVDVIVVDTAHGHSRGVMDRISWVKRQFPDVQVIGGNVTT